MWRCPIHVERSRQYRGVVIAAVRSLLGDFDATVQDLEAINGHSASMEQPFVRLLRDGEVRASIERSRELRLVRNTMHEPEQK